MVNRIQTTTAEKPISQTREEIIKEAQRIEEALLFSSKGHFAAAHFWNNFHLWIGVPMVLLSAIAGASAFSQFDNSHTAAGLISIVVAALSGVMTFFNPNEKSNSHVNAGNHYDSLMSKTRMFWSIECGSEDSEQLLTERLKGFYEHKDKLNQSSPQIPRWAYNKAKQGIENGEGDYTVDTK